MSAAATQRQAIVACLQAAGEDGVSLREMVDAGGGWWRQRLSELAREGVVVGEDRDRFYPVSGPTEALSSFEQPESHQAGLPGLRGDQAGDSASVEPDLTLFESRVGAGHYDDLGEAA
jgi:hypothetical protein